ncbi:MAG: dockerin type I domain-containing protein [Candidatus Bathyarchaeota archaeon]|nr:dockerin type I domain-containing protein [Candidatus Bathyarchaeota archaeon]
MQRIIPLALIIMVAGALMYASDAQPIGIGERLTGDVNHDGKVDLKDVCEVTLAVGSYPGHSRWNSEADVNQDKRIDMLDVYIVSSCFGEKSEAAICAKIRIYPRCLSLKSRGKWVTCVISLPEGYSVFDIDVSSLMLNRSISVDYRFLCFADCDGDGRYVLIVKFDRQAVVGLIQKQYATSCKFRSVTLTLTGTLADGSPFQGSDTIKTVINKPHC